MINITAIPHRDNILGKGYYLVSETMDKTWYKGETADEAVWNFADSTGYEGVICCREENTDEN